MQSVVDSNLRYQYTYGDTKIRQEIDEEKNNDSYSYICRYLYKLKNTE